MWSRKEAVIKADSKGFYLDLKEIDVTDRTAKCQGIEYEIVDIPTYEGYKMALAKAIKA